METAKIITVILVAIAGFIVGILLLQQKKIYERELDCSQYSHWSISDLPVGCYEYFGIKGGVGE